MANYTGQHFGPYRLLRLLGQNDGAWVYLGEHFALHTQVAIKLLALHLTSEEVQQFRIQTETLTRLTHPSLLQVLDSGVQGGLPFLVMDYAPGGNLQKHHPRGTILDPAVVLSYLTPIVAALQFIHEHGVIHGNLRPENLLLGRTNALLLSDGGLAVLRQRHLQQHTAQAASYLAPEQLDGEPLFASDQYALGTIVYEWLIGDVPFQGSFEEVATQHRSVTPVPLQQKVPSLTSAVSEVVLKALDKDPQLRFASVQAFAEELELACHSAQSLPEASVSHTISQMPFVFLASPAPPAPRAAAAGTMSCIYRGHSHFVYTLAWSPDSTHLASGSRDKTVQIWQATTGHLVFSHQGHHDRVRAVAWSPDGRRIASAGEDGTVQIWEIATGHHLLTYDAHAPIVHSLTWSPDGTRLASDSTHLVQVWDAMAGTLLLTYRGHPYGVNAVAWSPTGMYLASASNDQTVQVWHATTGAPIYTYRGHTEEVLAVAWSPDGRHLASASSDRTIHVWGSATVGTICIYRGDTPHLETVAWSPDGTRIASGGAKGTVQVWDAATGSNVFLYQGHSGVFAHMVDAVAWSPDGTRIASAEEGSMVRVWQAP
jgi:serine/threonine protein kinase